jgi:hypothetical protein
MDCSTRSCAAIHAVVQDRELVALIFRGNAGPATFAALACVCRTWRVVCHEDEDVLRAVAAYRKGGVTKGVFARVFCLSSAEADALPRTEHLRLRGGKFYLYGEAAVEQVLADGGMAARRRRMARGDRSDGARYDPKPFLREQEEEEERQGGSGPRRQRYPVYSTPPRRRVDAYAISVLERLPYKVHGLYS